MKKSKALMGKASVLTLIGLAVLGACGGSDSSSNTTEAASTAPPASESAPTETEAPLELPDKVRIGYQNVPGGLLIVKNQELLEQALGDGVEVEWLLFDSGGSVNEAVLAGGVDFGLVGSSPTSRGISTGIEYQVPWIFDVIGEAEALVVKSDRGIETIADLKGKTIATPFASTAHFSLLAALADAGVPESDVNVIDSEPDAITAAWQQGDIDGAYVWDPNLSKLKADGAKILITSKELSERGKTTYDLAIVTNEFASKYPQVVQIFVDVNNQAVSIIKNDIEAAAKANGLELNITPEEAKVQLGGLVFLDAQTQAGADFLGGGLATNLFAAAQFNKAQGKIPDVAAEDAYRNAVVTTYAQAAK
ncbi:MAG: glycine/betaine ABC transporter substrate-binding protein [Acidimicrobiales bacterium mtb01]|nr:transporter substrate-binding domain-containing protein [Actinomycetota bacterium]TEX47826.1 MAG: glycine/betaine ABC transporter substrate-binding protein [Acidimicrobiales bacterium mtb01]